MGARPGRPFSTETEGGSDVRRAPPRFPAGAEDRREELGLQTLQSLLRTPSSSAATKGD